MQAFKGKQDFNGKTVVITGASSGIGAFLAKELVARGARVGLIARRRERLLELTEELEQAASRMTQERTRQLPVVAWREADVVDDAALAAALDGLEEDLGPVDIVVANAGYGRSESPSRHRAGEAMHLYDTNLFGMLRVIDWALPRFVERRSGHIVGVASVASSAGLPYNASYCGSKAAMRVHLQALRVTLSGYGVAVTTICPGFVKSELTDDVEYPMPFFWSTERAARKIADSIAKRRREVIFPWQMKALVILMTRMMPLSWFERITRRGNPKARIKSAS